MQDGKSGRKRLLFPLEMLEEAFASAELQRAEPGYSERGAGLAAGLALALAVCLSLAVFLAR